MTEPEDHVSEPEQDWAGPSSRTGWVNVPFDRRIWIPCLPGFPPGYDLETWAAVFSVARWDMSGLKHTSQDVDRLAAQLAAVHQGTFGHIPCHLAFVHTADPRQQPLPVFLGIWQTSGDRDARLRSLANADDPEAIEPPIVDEFSTPQLGRGLRVMRYLHFTDGSLYAALSYAWRVEQYQTDLRLFTSSPDLGRLQRAVPDIDELARAIIPVPHPDLTGD